MTPWSWYAGHLDEHTYDLACDVKTRGLIGIILVVLLVLVLLGRV